MSQDRLDRARDGLLRAAASLTHPEGRTDVFEAVYEATVALVMLTGTPQGQRATEALLSTAQAACAGRLP